MGGLPANKTIYAFAASSVDPKIMFAGLRERAFRSRDGGKTWTKLRGAPADVAALAIHPKSPEVIYIGTAEGKIFTSGDGGESWRRQN